MKIRRLKRDTLIFAIVGAIGGTLQGLSWPQYEHTIFNLVFFVPFLLAATRTKTWRQALVLGLSHGIFGALFGFHWLAYMAESFGGVPKWLSPSVVVLYSLVGQGHNFVIALVLFALRKRWQIRLPLIALPALYVVIDALYPKLFCDTQGATLYKWHELTQMAEYTGVYGLTFLVLWFNAALAAVVAPLVSRVVKSRIEGPASVRAGFVHLFALVVVVASLHFWGSARINALDTRSANYPRKITASIIQANIGDADKLASEQGSTQALRFVLDTYEKLTREAVAKFHPDLVIWPETSYPYLYTHHINSQTNASGESRDKWLTDLVASVKTPIYFGGYSSDGKHDFNAAWLVTGREQPAGLYQKNILLAFGETVPLGPLAPYLRDVFPAMGNFGRGPGPTNLLFRGLRLGPLICYETLDPGYVRQTVRLGADFLLNLTNDSWFGPTAEPVSHMLLSVFRTIETRRSLLRATNTGISALIDETGRVLKPTGVFTAAIYTADLRMPAAGAAETTFYLRFGPWLTWLCGVFVALCIAAARWRFMTRPRSSA